MKTSSGYDLNYLEPNSSQKSNMAESNYTTKRNEEFEKLEKLLKQLNFLKKAIIHGYKNLIINFTYKPIEIGDFELPLIVYFENFLHSPPLDIIVK